MSTLIDRLIHASQPKYADIGPIFVDRRENETFFSWAQVYERARQAATVLHKLGLKKGDRVGIILPTCIGFMDSFFGCQLLGVIPVPMYPPVRLGKLDAYFARTATMLAEANISLIITEGRIKRILGQLIQRYRPHHGMLTTNQLLGKDDCPNIDLNADDLAMAQFSSGTTQTPKPVGLSHRQILANVDAILESIPADAILKSPAGCSWLPLYHDMGLIGCIFPAITYPGRMILISPEVFLAKPAIWLRAISKHKAIISPAPNFAYAYCFERIKDSDVSNCDLSSWAAALNGAEAVAPIHLKQFQQRFQQYGLSPAALTPVYGLSEAALAISFYPIEKPVQFHHFQRQALRDGHAKPCASHDTDSIEMVSVGQPLQGFQFQIRRVDGSLAEHGQIGEIWVTGPSLMAGYLNAVPSPIHDGWLKTGDLGFIHQDELFISGRSKDMIVLRGRNHSPQEFEYALDEIDGIRKGCSIAVGNISEQGEELIIFAEYKDKIPDMAEICRKKILAATGINPDLVVLTEPGTLLRTSSGKLRRKATLASYQAGSLVPPKKVNPWFIAGTLAKSAIAYLQGSR